MAKHQCTHCLQVLTRRSYLRRHIRRFHGNLNNALFDQPNLTDDPEIDNPLMGALDDFNMEPGHSNEEHIPLSNEALDATIGSADTSDHELDTDHEMDEEETDQDETDQDETDQDKMDEEETDQDETEQQENFNSHSDPANMEAFCNDFRPFPTKLMATVFILLFGCKRHLSVQQMKVLWAIFHETQTAVPSLHAVLAWRKKIGGVIPECRETSTGVKVYQTFDANLSSPLVQKRCMKVLPTVNVFLCCTRNGMGFLFTEGWITTYSGMFSNAFKPMVGNCPQHVQGSLSLKANGKPVIHFPVALTTDETSGNRSKRYNKFESCFVYFPALPAKFHGPSYIHFVCTSHDGDWRDVNEAVLMDFKPNGALDSGIEVYDAHTNQTVIVVSHLFTVLADNPRHYQVCNLGGATSNYNCRCCMATKGDLQVAPARTHATTLETLQQMHNATSKARQDMLQTQTGVSVPTPAANPFNSVSNFYPPQQTPIDLLHTLSLGVIKYSVRDASAVYKKRPGSVASQEFQAAVGNLFKSVTSYRGPHSVTPLQFMVHCGSLIAKDFKFIAQIGPFLYHWFIPAKKWLWVAIAAVTKLSYDMRYQSSEQQHHLLQKAVGALQALFKKHVPGWGGSSKLHLLSHLPEHFIIWGPLSLYGVEAPEHMNGDVRHSIINSNRQNSSRDTAADFAVREEIAYLLRGGGGAGYQLVEMAELPLVKKLVRLEQASQPTPILRPGSFYFIHDWHRIAKVESVQNKIATVTYLTLTTSISFLGMQTYKLAERSQQAFSEFNGQADVFHDCWSSPGCRWDKANVSSIMHLTNYLFSIRFDLKSIILQIISVSMVFLMFY
ncbi:hypothetical protein CcCBS67573_g09707 [Chytriomyces confervae]|uniref:C2H2-type domain-containing protein n=1 Tax=Chytriomyces confervae TaxID=246404 RepID=A0A507DPA7_9FUNG|nr:hypothetical protein CcCBS67573_g09707 [Chytriomyces confervae]